MRRGGRRTLGVVLALALLDAAAGAQGAYQPRFPGDPARSEPEAAALGYMRTLLGAQREYKKKHGAYAPSLAALVHSGSFTRRMAKADRGDYTVSFRGGAKSFSVALTPKQFDAGHRAFFGNETGVIRAQDNQPADAASPPLK